MKKIFTLLLLVLLPFFIFSQVEIVSHDATKTYPDDTRITYMQLSDYPIDNDFLQFVEKEVLTNTLIQRFSLSKNGGTCFFHSHKDITEEMIVEAINDAILAYSKRPQKLERDFASRGYVNDLHLTKFTLDIDIDDDLLREIITIFKESDIIIDVDYRNNSQFEVTSKDLIYPADIEKLLAEWDIKIVKEDIK